MSFPVSVCSIHFAQRDCSYPIWSDHCPGWTESGEESETRPSTNSCSSNSSWSIWALLNTAAAAETRKVTYELFISEHAIQTGCMHQQHPTHTQNEWSHLIFSRTTTVQKCGHKHLESTHTFSAFEYQIFWTMTPPPRPVPSQLQQTLIHPLLCPHWSLCAGKFLASRKCSSRGKRKCWADAGLDCYLQISNRADTCTGYCGEIRKLIIEGYLFISRLQIQI